MIKVMSESIWLKNGPVKFTYFMKRNIYMKENKNFVEYGIKKEDAYQILSIINTWISNLDSKISFALAFTGVLISMIFSGGFPNAFRRISEVSKLSELNGGEVIAALLVVVLYSVSILSISCFIWAIMARTKNTNNVYSIFFFGSIGNMELQNYKYKLSHMTEKELIDDLQEQIHTNSQICNQKSKWYNYGMKLLLIMLVFWFICTVFGMR